MVFRSPRRPFVGLSSAPNDWTIASSYTVPGYGLSVQNGTSVSMDIGQYGNLYVPATFFPGNPANTGAINLQPSGTSILAAYIGFANITHPQYLAVDSSADGVIWITDQESKYVGLLRSQHPSTTASSRAPTPPAGPSILTPKRRDLCRLL